MTNQPYDGHEPRQWRQPAQGYDDPRDAEQYTQQWQGQTWETSVQPPVPAAPAEETAYLPQPQPQPP
ncbi:hypothetical protein NGM37_05470, partial [Streptomyces sp. TRM76130]|nr:hypothetical protein [Streptomyces sp. TRM76130]